MRGSSGAAPASSSRVISEAACSTDSSTLALTPRQATTRVYPTSSAPITRMISALTSVRRRRIGREASTVSGLPQGEADAAHRMDQAWRATFLELPAEIPDVDVDHVRVDIRVLAPDGAED